jgi:hypothetical protein
MIWTTGYIRFRVIWTAKEQSILRNDPNRAGITASSVPPITASAVALLPLGRHAEAPELSIVGIQNHRLTDRPGPKSVSGGAVTSV